LDEFVEKKVLEFTESEKQREVVEFAEEVTSEQRGVCVIVWEDSAVKHLVRGLFDAVGVDNAIVVEGQGRGGAAEFGGWVGAHGECDGGGM
jgi:hypothetical protein